jgi:hypothetical protein
MLQSAADNRPLVLNEDASIIDDDIYECGLGMLSNQAGKALSVDSHMRKPI